MPQCKDPHALLLTEKNKVSITLDQRDCSQEIQNIPLKIEFKVIPQSEGCHLPMRFTSPTTGFMTSLGFQRGLSNPEDVPCLGKIVVPLGHRLMISIAKINLPSIPRTCLRIYLTDLRGDVRRVMNECGGLTIVPADVYPSAQWASVVLVKEQSYFAATGFKLLFSFHQLGHLPEKLPSGLFNCSRDEYPSFRQHLHCNLDQECEEGQDETGDCPYSSHKCRGQLASDNKCFFLVGTDRFRQSKGIFSYKLHNSSHLDWLIQEHVYSQYNRVSWNTAARECEQNNGRLAAFTEQQFQDVLKLGTYSKVFLTPFHIGFKFNWKYDLFMYRKVLKSFDGTLLYFMRQLKDIQRPIRRDFALGIISYPRILVGGLDLCAVGLVNPRSQELTVELANCNNEHSASLGLCERTASVNDSFLNSPDTQTEHQSTLMNAAPFNGLISNTTTVDNLCNNRSYYSLVVCPCGHVTHSFLSCDLHSYCGEERYVDECPVLSPAHCQSRLRQWSAQYQKYTSTTRHRAQTNTSSDQSLSTLYCTDYVDDVRDHETSASVIMFVCSNQATVHYSLVCDFRSDCLDDSDETFCVHPNCKGFTCMNRQCVSERNRCDHTSHCLDDSDENHCYFNKSNWDMFYERIPRQPPGLIDLDGTGSFVSSDWSQNQPCPVTHYRCASHPRYCLPVYTRCNGYFDCHGREDELDCDIVRCPGLYRCRGSRVCVHVQHMCDGWPQCPQHDDEWRCQATSCPESCLCQGLAFVCHGPFPPSDHPDLRYLTMNSTPVTLSSFSLNVYLIFLSLVRCQISNLSLGMRLPNVQMLDLSHNNITTLNTPVFKELPNIKVLRLAHNPVLDLVGGEHHTKLSPVRVADFSNTLIETFSIQALSLYSQIKLLNLSHSRVHTIGDAGFQFSQALEVLDMRGCPLKHFRLDLFRGLHSLSVVYSPNFRMCCDGILPDQVIKPICLAPVDHLSSCENLLASRSYQVALFVISIVATAGSTMCLISRCTRHQESVLSGCELWVSNINVASLLMGLYAGIIAVADELYRGRYVLREKDWTESVTCQTACFLHLLSHQVSVLTMLVISLDRLALLYFPYSRLRLNAVSAVSVCFVTWCVGVVVAVIQSVSAWPFHKQSALCVPLPALNGRFVGDHFHFGVVILQTVTVSSLIAVCEAFIFIGLKQRAHSCLSTMNKYVLFAERIYPVVMGNAVCWFFVSVYGLVTKLDATSAESQLNVVLAVLLFPFHAAFSPVALIYRQMQEDNRRDSEMKLLNSLRLRALHQHK